MKPQLSGPKKRPSVSKPAGAEAALSLQEELVAAIHGAFEVAVEIAIGEVTKLVGRATGGIYEEMRRENECLKQRLQTAEALLDSARMEERGGSSPPPPPPPPTKQQSPNPKVVKVQSCRVRGDTPPVGPSDHKHESRHEEQRSGDGVKTQRVSDAASHPEGSDGCAGALTKEDCEETSRVCVVRLESIQQMCRDSPPPLHTGDEAFTLEQVTVKQEKPDEEEEEEEEEKDGSGCCLDSIKVEDFSPECMSAVHSQMLDEWKPEELHIQSQDSNTTLSCTGLAQACSPSTDPQPSLSSDFPNIFQLAEPGPVPEAPAQVYGVHVRTGRNLVHTLTNLYACKFCGQTFHLPSLLRRHHGQCQQKLQQCYQQPVAGNRRSRLQIYPPGCSPFRCTECNREFNRMENLKTHLRIHTGERPYTCSVCSKCFRHSGALTRHFRIHTGEKPYICGQCGKSFRNCGGLKFHQRSHIKQLQ